MNRIQKVAALGCVACGLAVASRAEIVYDNLTTPLGNYIGGFGAYEEVADDVSLAGSSRIFESVSVAYTGANIQGGASLTSNLYAMDGAPTSGSFGFNTPGTLLFTGTLPIGNTLGSLATFSDASGSISLPDHVGIGLSFTGITFDPAGADAGPLVYDPPTVGSSFNDFWLRGFPAAGDPWALYTLPGGVNANFGLQINATTVVPEPATWIGMGSLMLLAGTIVVRRFRTAK